LAERAGRAYAPWLAVFGEALTGSEAAALGIVARVVPVDDLERVTSEVTQHLSIGLTRA
jgi:enoyl-CoA hydratase/carnithine racemase